MTSEGERETPRRLRAADVIAGQREIIDQLTHRQSRVGDASVTFTRNAKGETQISVEVSAPVGTDDRELGETAVKVYAEAVARYEEAIRRFPTATGTVTNDAPPRD